MGKKQMGFSRKVWIGGGGVGELYPVYLEFVANPQCDKLVIHHFMCNHVTATFAFQPINEGYFLVSQQ